MDALVGDTGFVGGNLLRQHRFDARFNSRSIDGITGRHFATLVFAGAQGRKWWANQNPAEDRAGIARALAALEGVRADRCVLISTVDVVPQTVGADESFDCAALPNHAYGANRLWLEAEMRARFPQVQIVRLPALFGFGLRKNVIYDLLHDNMVDRIDPEGRFQFYDLDGAWRDIETAAAAGLDLLHLVTEPVAVRDIAAAFFPAVRLTPPPEDGSPLYDLRTRHAALFGGRDGYIQDRAEVMHRLAAFIATARGAA